MQKLGEIPLERIREAEHNRVRAISPLPDSDECGACGGARFVRSLDAPRAEPCPVCNPVPATWGIPERLADASFENFDLHLNETMAGAVRRCRDVADGRAWCALLMGDPGLGKSHLAAAALRVSVHVKPGLFWSSGAWLRNIRHLVYDEGGPGLDEGAVLANYETTACLFVLDDLGKEKLTEWAAQTLYTVLNARYERKLPTIITTNAPAAIDDAVLDRFYEGAMVCRGKSIRRIAGGV